jgi:acyl carrier protein
MNQDIFIRLKEFVVNKSGVDDEPIDKATRIQEDLGVSGDDAVEFILAYSKEFNVDVTNFMAADYFEAEGGLRIWSLLKDLLGFNKQGKTLTVGHLEKGIYAGKLDEGIINATSDV